MSLKRCSTCKWWTPSEAEDCFSRERLNDENGDWVYLGDPPQSMDLFPGDGTGFVGNDVARVCTNPKIGFFTVPAPGCASVKDGSEYQASFITAPDFGCVLWEDEPVKD